MPESRAANDNRTLDADQAANDNYNLADDMLWGASAIALFLYGDRRKRRKVYHLAATSRLPHSKAGVICARKSVLLEWLRLQEERSVIKERKQA